MKPADPPPSGLEELKTIRRWNGSERLPSCSTDKVRGLLALIAIVGLNWGFVRTLIFLYDQWGGIGVWVGFTFVPPLLICPVWEWIASGSPLTFLLVYVIGIAPIALLQKLEP